MPQRTALAVLTAVHEPLRRPACPESAHLSHPLPAYTSFYSHRPFPQAFTREDWDRHITWRRYLPEVGCTSGPTGGSAAPLLHAACQLCRAVAGCVWLLVRVQKLNAQGKQAARGFTVCSLPPPRPTLLPSHLAP